MSEQRLCRVEEIPKDGGLRVCIAGIEPLAIFRCDRAVHVVQDTCPHAGASLAEGWVEDHRVTCPAHNAEFCLRTGAPLSFPANETIKTFPSRIVDGEVLADLPTASRVARIGEDGLNAER